MIQIIQNLKGDHMQHKSFLQPYLQSAHGILYLLSPEENRVEQEILDAFSNPLIGKGGQVWTWTINEGLHQVGKDNDQKTENPVDALKKIYETTREKSNKLPTIYIFKDLHPFFTNPKVTRFIREISNLFPKVKGQFLILISPINKLPEEIQRDVTLLEFQLPTEEIIKEIWTTQCQPTVEAAIGTIKQDELDKIIDAAKGLTTQETANVLSLGLVKHVDFLKETKNTLKKKDIKELSEKDRKDITPISQIVLQEKAKAIKKTGVLEFWNVKQTASDVGGLAILRQWLDERKSCFSKAAREFGVPQPKGIVLVGLPGCGKSLISKVTSSIFEIPLIRFDLARVFAGLVGESETRMWSSLKTIDAIGSSIVWMDELEKALAGVKSTGDSGVSQRVFGQFLTWLQERTSNSFVVATINRIEGIPPELTRKGRFDEIFFLGLPNNQDREEILSIHIKKKGRNVDEFKKHQETWKACIEKSEGFTGSELEEAINSALILAYHQRLKDNTTDLSPTAILNAIKNIIPISTSKKNDFNEMISWAKTYAINANQEESNKKDYSRKISVNELNEN